MIQQIKNYIREMKQRVFTQEVKGKHVDRAYKTHAYCIFLLSIVNIIFGIWFTFIYYNLYDVRISYNESETHNVFLPAGEINFYIQIEDFYQSHLKNSKSISYKQLEGKKDVDSKRTEPVDYINDIPIYPAGILPNTYFQDQFILENLQIDETPLTQETPLQQLQIETEGISWDNQTNDIKKTQYTRNEVVPPPLWKNYTQIPNLHEDERFTNWIYTAPYYTFRKLWGKINVPTTGLYKLRIENTYKYGKKSVIFSQNSWAGNKNYFFSICMIAAGGIGIIAAYIINKYF